MAHAGVDGHDSTIEHSAPRAAERDCRGASVVRCATTVVCAQAAIAGPVKPCTVTALMEEQQRSRRPVTGLTFPS